MAVTPAGNRDVSSPSLIEVHLRTIVETQPACLMRVAFDGGLRAVNESARSMLGCENLSEALGKNLSDFLPVDQQDVLRSFIRRVAGGARESLEVSMVGLQQSQYTVELRGVPLDNAPDGVASALVAFRDVSEQRRLEQSLIDGLARYGQRTMTDGALAPASVGDEDTVRVVQLESLLQEKDERLQAAVALAADMARLLEEHRLAAEKASVTISAQCGRVVELEGELDTSGARCRESKALVEISAQKTTELTAELQELRGAYESAQQELASRAQEIESLMVDLHERVQDAETRAESSQRRQVEADLEWTAEEPDSLDEWLRSELSAAMGRIFQQAAASLQNGGGRDSRQQAANLHAIARVTTSMAALLSDSHS